MPEGLLTFVKVGPRAEINLFDVEGNTEADRQVPMFGPGRIDHIGFEADDLAAFEATGRRQPAGDARGSVSLGLSRTSVLGNCGRRSATSARNATAGLRHEHGFGQLRLRGRHNCPERAGVGTTRY